VEKLLNLTISNNILHIDAENIRPRCANIADIELDDHSKSPLLRVMPKLMRRGTALIFKCERNAAKFAAITVSDFATSKV
jgi:hypothetical protein